MEENKSKKKGKERVYSLYKAAHWCYVHKLRITATLLRSLMRIIFSCDIHPGATIGKNCSFPHDGLGIIIDPRAIIGDNCIILHGVTFGGRGRHHGVPKLGNNVTIGCHSQLLGPITIGDNAIVGAGSVVIHDVPANTVVAGNPAKQIIQKNA